MATDQHYSNQNLPIPHDLELRKIKLDHRPKPTIDFLLVTGSHLPSAQQACQRFAHNFAIYLLDLPLYLQHLRDTTRHDRAAYGTLHPSAYRERFYHRMIEPDFLNGTALPFFLLPILTHKIAREMENGWRRFMILGLEALLRATREFTLKVIAPWVNFSGWSKSD